MIIRQISLMLKNEPGAMAAVLELLEKNGINLRALTLSDSTEFSGILRIIVKDPGKTEKLLLDSGYPVKNDPILTIALDDHPGSLYEKMQMLSDAGINIEYTYAFASSDDSGARVVLKADKLELADKILKGQQIDDDDMPVEVYW
ncbi:MAG: acetolactate synthase 3 regulatory subunit [Firmicutes bacterium]|nr:acetolactate synthase 3 regulatory subunit [Bacillota bacterium]